MVIICIILRGSNFLKSYCHYIIHTEKILFYYIWIMLEKWFFILYILNMVKEFKIKNSTK